MKTGFPETPLELVALTSGREGARLHLVVTPEMVAQTGAEESADLFKQACALGIVRLRTVFDEIISGGKIFQFALTAKGAALYASFP